MPRSKLVSWSLVLTALIATLAAAPALHAQLFDDEKKPKGDGSMPTFTGKGKINEAINGDTGAVFDIGGGITMLFPKGLPVGRSRLVTLQKARGLPTRLIDGFKPVGPAIEFTGAFNTSGKPMVLAYSTKQNPVRSGQKLVVAMEVGTFCEKENKAFKLKSGLCSGFELHDAEYDATSKRVVANLRSTGGLRMQFGTVPETSDEE